MRNALAAVALILACPLALAAQPELVLEKEVLSEGIVLFRAPSDLDLWTATNTVVMVNDDDVTVFDSNTRAVTARMVIAEIRKLTSKPVRTLINSHWHMDHWSGNDEYRKAFPGLEIIATRETRDYMKRMGPASFAHSLFAGAERGRTALAEAERTGKQSDGTPFTPEARAGLEKDIAERQSFAEEVLALPRVLPTMAFEDRMTFWRGRREFRLWSVTGDATGSAVLYLPAEKILITGDVLVAPEKDPGPPPWTTNSYSITPWLEALRGFEALDTAVIVPGQGPAFHDKMYLQRTARLYAAIIDQVHAALERGVVKLDDVQAAVNVDAIGLEYTPGAAAPSPEFKSWVSRIAQKVYLESLDGVTR